MADDDLDLDIGDLPVPPEPESELAIKDEFDYNVSFNFAFIGVGQGGGRIADTFSKMGYGRVCALNTTKSDLTHLSLKASRKLDLGGSGAGKDPGIGAAAVEDRDEDIYDLFKRSWGESVDYALVCFGAGGGTGAGGYKKVAEVARKYLEDNHREPRVGIIVALPKEAEGQRPALNTIATVRELVKSDFSPILIIDNQRIKELFRPSPSSEYPKANGSVAKMLHLFNRLSGSDSEHENFDRADFAKVLDSGVVAFGTSTITSWPDATTISKAIRDQLRKSTLVAVDLSKGKRAGLLYVLNGTSYEDVPVDYLDYSVEMLTGMLAEGSTVYRGIYKGTGKKDSIQVLAMIGELPWPEGRLLELANKAGIPKEDMAGFLGV